jgi:integrase
MQSDILSRHTKTTKNKWRKVQLRGVTGLYQYRPSGMYHARVRHGGKLYRESLETTDLALAKRKLHDYKNHLERTDARNGKVSFIDWLERYYAPTLKGVTLKDATLTGGSGAAKAKLRIIERIKDTWFDARKPMRDLKKSQVLTWLNEQYGDWSESYWNSALSLIRDALDMALNDNVIVENPTGALKYHKRKNPIRLKPSFDEFKTIVTGIRSQPFNRDAEDSGDFVEALGVLGLGQAELASMKREHVNLDAGQVVIYRQKTGQRFTIPIYPWARALMEKLCNGKKPGEKLFNIKQARKAITEACKRLDLPIYTHRSLRRMFVTTAIERGIDVQTVSRWQGHRDGGKLILQTYSDVRDIHSQRMAQLMSDSQPENVISIKAGAA